LFKTIHDELWALDAEWVPDPPTGRRVYGLPAELDDDRVVQHMWQAGGATEDAAAGGKPGVTARTRLRAVTRARWAVPRGEGGGAGKKARGPHGRAQQAVRTGGT